MPPVSYYPITSLGSGLNHLRRSPLSQNGASLPKFDKVHLSPEMPKASDTLNP